MQLNKIQEKVDNCLGKRELVFPMPIDQLASEYGFSVKHFSPSNDPDLVKISGAIEYDKKIIWANSDDVPERQRFTIAHELGHAVLHPNENIIDYRMDGDFSPKELEANEFAARVLMPASEIKKVKVSLEQMKEKNIVSSLAQYFGVSMQAMMVRLQKI